MTLTLSLREKGFQFGVYPSCKYFLNSYNQVLVLDCKEVLTASMGISDLSRYAMLSQKIS